MSSESSYPASGTVRLAETICVFRGLFKDENSLYRFGLDGQGFLQFIALAGLVSGVVLRASS